MNIGFNWGAKCIFGLTLLASHAANAALISGDFRTESNLPDVRTGSPLVYQSLGQAIGSGYELDGDNFYENPSDWMGGEVWMDYDPTSNILTLNSQDQLDFKTFDAWISNIVFDVAGERISGITMLSNGITDPTVVPTLSYTANSLHISYDYMPETFDFITGGIAAFQIEISSVPEPASFALLGLGLVALGFARRGVTA